MKNGFFTVEEKVKALFNTIQISIEQVFPAKKNKNSGNEVPKYVRKLVKKTKVLTKKIINSKSPHQMVPHKNDLENVEAKLAKILNDDRSKKEESVIDNIKMDAKLFYYR